MKSHGRHMWNLHREIQVKFIWKNIYSLSIWKLSSEFHMTILPVCEDNIGYIFVDILLFECVFFLLSTFSVYLCVYFSVYFFSSIFQEFTFSFIMIYIMFKYIEHVCEFLNSYTVAVYLFRILTFTWCKCQ